MRVRLTEHAEELLKQQLARSGSSPEEVIERALETLAGQELPVSWEERERRHAVADMQAFAEKHKLTLDRTEKRLRDLMHEGHKY